MKYSVPFLSWLFFHEVTHVQNYRPFRLPRYARRCRGGINEYQDFTEHRRSEPFVRMALSPKVIAICKQLKVSSQWQIDQLMRQQISEAMHAGEHNTAKHRGDPQSHSYSEKS